MSILYLALAEVKMCHRSEYISIGALGFIKTQIINNTSLPEERKCIILTKRKEDLPTF